MQETILTARNLYRLLIVGAGIPSRPVPLIKPMFRVTQREFWWCFLAEAIPEEDLLPYFSTIGSARPRALSNLMNRTVPHSTPVKLYRAMEERLTPENTLFITLWIANVLDEYMHPLVIHEALTRMENQVEEAGNDPEFSNLYDFFVSLRPKNGDRTNGQHGKLFIQAAFRFAMLGLHAVYGDQMSCSAALQRLRNCSFCDPDTLADAAVGIAPRIEEKGFNFKRLAIERAEKEFQNPPIPPETEEILSALEGAARQALPPEDIRAAHQGPNAGWYVVSDWMDFYVSVNDVPRATYHGANPLGTIPNGTLLYVLSAPGYRGLHVSAGIWGKILWGNAIAWVPMNLLARLKTGQGETEEKGSALPAE